MCAERGAPRAGEALFTLSTYPHVVGPEVARAALEAAAGLGCGDARARLGELLLAGTPQAHDDGASEEALLHLHAAADAVLPHREAQRRLGMAYMYGASGRVRRDRRAGRRYLVDAAADDPVAQHEAGKLALHGDGGATPSPARARHFFAMARRRGGGAGPGAGAWADVAAEPEPGSAEALRIAKMSGVHVPPPVEQRRRWTAEAMQAKKKATGTRAGDLWASVRLPAAKPEIMAHRRKLAAAAVVGSIEAPSASFASTEGFSSVHRHRPATASLSRLTDGDSSYGAGSMSTRARRNASIQSKAERSVRRRDKIARDAREQARRDLACSAAVYRQRLPRPRSSRK